MLIGCYFNGLQGHPSTGAVFPPAIARLFASYLYLLVSHQIDVNLDTTKIHSEFLILLQLFRA